MTYRKMQSRRSGRGRALRSLATAGAVVGLGCAQAALATETSAGSAGPSSNVYVSRAERVSPQANTTVANARVIVPDGTNVHQDIGASETRWLVFGAEPGKTYTLEVIDPYGDFGANFIGSVSVVGPDGVSAPPNTQIGCGAAKLPPSVDVSSDGVRCIIYTFAPDSGDKTINQRGIYVGVASGGGSAFQIRIRESTIYGRWTTNGYDFHVELQNTTASTVCAQLNYYGDAGFSIATGTWVGLMGFFQLTIPPFGAAKYVRPNGTPAGGPGGELRGTLRIVGCPSATSNFVAGALNVSTYAYNPVTDKFVYFFTTPANNGATSSTF